MITSKTLFSSNTWPSKDHIKQKLGTHFSEKNTFGKLERVHGMVVVQWKNVGQVSADMYPKIKFHQNIEIIYRWRFKKLS